MTWASGGRRRGAASLNKRVLGGLAGLGTVDVRGVVRQAGSRVRLALREVKGAHSSEFECAVVKGTRPDDLAAKDKHVSRLVDSVATFPMAMAAREGHQTDYYGR